MPAKKSIPPICFHKTTGRYYCWHEGKRHPLGKDKAEAERKHRAFVAGLLAGKPEAEAAPAPAGGLLVAEALARYLKAFVPTMDYRDAHRTTKAVDSVVRAFGSLPVESFRFIHLEQVVTGWASEVSRRGGVKLSANYIRKLLGSVRHAWKWMAVRDLVTAESCGKIALAVAAVKIPAPDAPKSQPVTPEQFRRTMAHADDMTRAMATLQLLTGMRTGELLRINSGEIARSGSTWVYAPARHKNLHRGKPRRIYLDAECQALLSPYLLSSPCFPVTLGVYSHRLNRAADKAGVERWRPYLARHARATEAAIESGDEAARLILGHSSKAILSIYTHEAEEIKRRRAG